MKKTVEDIDVRGKRVLVRCDFNVPLDGSGRITDDRRIRCALPTIKRLLDGGGRLILMSHLGRPKGDGPEDRKKFTLAPVAKRLSELIGKPVELTSECVGEEVSAAVAAMKEGDVVLLENLRFNPPETIKDKAAAANAALREQKDNFAEALAELADVYINDAFGTCHRDNASMLTVPQMMEGKPRVVGYLVRKELEFLGGAVADPVRPFVCVLGGAKVSDKLGVIQSLLAKCDTILVGGAMAYTFLKADGLEVGKSLVEEDLLETARSLRVEAGDKLKLPADSVVAAEIKEGAVVQVVEGAIPSNQMGLDIGPKTVSRYREIVCGAKTIVWNGPMGVIETPPFDRGTMAMASAMAQATDAGAVTIIGGGDSAAAVDKAGLDERMSHVSTGGGASLEFLEGKTFAAIDVLDDA
ncbi:MAG: phosphoglycerate kinase [Phycisphaerales bacterium]|nr:MAG: phosphoglycerate kinase [Phycisphaerales bacterium]